MNLKITLRKSIKYGLIVLTVLFVLLNISAAFHGYKFTHFSGNTPKTKAANMTLVQKATMLFAGVSNPRPENKKLPEIPFDVHHIASDDDSLELWYIPASEPGLGTVVLAHGYAGTKSSMLPRAEFFRSLGYNILLFDFPGSGGSSGNYTSIGYRESADVWAVYRFANAKFKGPIILQGTSMGAVAILKAFHEYELHPHALIVECPFASLLQTGKNRFQTMGLPTFPAAHLLTFWGGAQSGFNGFCFEPEEYAKKVSVQTLLIHGMLYNRVKLFETEHIFRNLNGRKQLLKLEQSGHADYLDANPVEYKEGITQFLTESIR